MIEFKNNAVKDFLPEFKSHVKKTSGNPKLRDFTTIDTRPTDSINAFFINVAGKRFYYSFRKNREHDFEILKTIEQEIDIANPDSNTKVSWFGDLLRHYTQKDQTFELGWKVEHHSEMLTAFEAFQAGALIERIQNSFADERDSDGLFKYMGTTPERKRAIMVQINTLENLKLKVIKNLRNKQK